MLCVAKNNSEYVEVTPVKVVQDNSLLNVIKGINSYNTSNYPFELTADMWDENSTEIYKYKYAYNKNITKVEIPNGITSIGESAFYGCSSLTSIIIPDSVTSIESYVFNACNNLISVKMGQNLTSIASYAFYRCGKLAIVDFRSATQVPTVQSYSFRNVPTTCKFIIPDSLYDSWITATNWSAMYANGYQFIKASEYTEA